MRVREQSPACLPAVAAHCWLLAEMELAVPLAEMELDPAKVVAMQIATVAHYPALNMSVAVLYTPACCRFTQRCVAVTSGVTSGP